MPITHPTRLLTADDLEAMGSEIKLLELYDGVLRETERMGGRHGEFQLEISSPLHASAPREALNSDGTKLAILSSAANEL